MFDVDGIHTRFLKQPTAAFTRLPDSIVHREPPQSASRVQRFVLCVYERVR